MNQEQQELIARLIKLGLLTAVSIDAAYTTVFWLVLGRPHPCGRYLAIVGLLSVEVVTILRLIEKLKETSDDLSEAT